MALQKSMLLFVLFSFVGLSYAQTTGDREKVLDVAVYDSAPFGFPVSDATYGGLMVELWEEMADQLGWQYTYHLEDMEGLLDGLETRCYYVGLGAISITPMREARVDFTQPVNPSGTGVAFAKTEQSSFEMYWKPILTSLLKLIGGLLLVLFISALAVWLVERHSNKVTNEKTINNLGDAFWWSAVTMTTVGYGDKVPTTSIGKVFGIIWIFASIILLSLFTANTSAILNRTPPQMIINSQEDLRHLMVGAAVRSSGAEFLQRERIPFQPYLSVELAVEDVIDGHIDVVVSNVPVLQYLNNSTYYQQIQISPTWLLKNNMGMALQEDSPLKESIDRVLLQTIAEPEWQKAVYKYLGRE